MLNVFKVNKIDDSCAAGVDTAKLISIGLAYGDIITYRQVFKTASSIVEKSYKERADELKKRLKRPHSKDTWKRNESKMLSIQVGLKCAETNQKSKKEKYTLKTNQGYVLDVEKETSCSQLHKQISDHYTIPRGRDTFIGHYSGKAIKANSTISEIFQQQKEKKKSLQVYLYYPKSFADLELKRMLQSYTDKSNDDSDSTSSEVEVGITLPIPNFLQSNSLISNTMHSPSVTTSSLLSYQQHSISNSLNRLPTPYIPMSDSVNQLPTPYISRSDSVNQVPTRSLYSMLPLLSTTSSPPGVLIPDSPNLRSTFESLQSSINQSLYQTSVLVTDSDQSQPTTAIIESSSTQSLSDESHQTLRNICSKCHCSYTSVSCMRCEQNEEYDQSLEQDQNNSENKVEEASISVAQVSVVRQARLAHFNRSRTVPVRYRHSIGSPSLSYQDDFKTDDDVPASTSNTYCFGDNEVERFLSSEVEQDIVFVDEQKTNIISFIERAKDDFDNIVKQEEAKHIMIQRDPHRFWYVIFKQKFDLSTQDTVIRFSREAGADLGGPQREFFTLAMKRFTQIPGIIFGDIKSIGIKLIPEYLINNYYYMIGQLTGMSILKIGRGPECFNLMLVQSIFNVKFDANLPLFSDGFLTEKINRIKNGDKDDLLDSEITPSGIVEKDLRMFVISYVILKNAGAIEQFSRGLASISPWFLSPVNYDIMKQFLMENNAILTVEQFLELIEFERDCEQGSNKNNQINDLACDFELFVASLWNNEIPEKTLSDFLYLLTGLEKIPPFGLEKKIEVQFSEIEKFAKISTCSFKLTLPMSNIQNILKLCLQFGGGLGSV